MATGTMVVVKQRNAGPVLPTKRPKYIPSIKAQGVTEYYATSRGTKSSELTGPNNETLILPNLRLPVGTAGIACEAAGLYESQESRLNRRQVIRLFQQM